MKKIILLAFALVAVVVADDDDMASLAARFETDVETVEACMMEAQTSIEEMREMKQKWKMMLNEDLDEDTKQSMMKQHIFLACMLEKKDMMKDSKLIMEKIIEAIEKNQSKYPNPISTDTMKECITALNENEGFGREDRAKGLAVCFVKSGVPIGENE